MKCKYKFPATANVTFETGLKFDHAGRTYELEVKDELLISVSITVHDYPDEYLPTITPLENQLAKASFNIPEDSFRDEIVDEIRAFEGGLCIWGLDEIDVDALQIEWIPESATDEAKLQLLSFSSYIRKRSERVKSVAQMDAFVRTILIRKHLLQWETALNFYRRGRIDLAEGRHIESIHDTFFALETLFANGKFKKSQVVVEFLRANELLEAIDYLQSRPHAEHCPQNLMTSYMEKFANKSQHEVIEYIVETRGFLHHHTNRRSGMWHPAKQREYHVDAIIFTNICSQIMMKKTIDLIFDQDNFAEFLNTPVFASNGTQVNWKFENSER